MLDKESSRLQLQLPEKFGVSAKSSEIWVKKSTP